MLMASNAVMEEDSPTISDSQKTVEYSLETEDSKSLEKEHEELEGVENEEQDTAADEKTEDTNLKETSTASNKKMGGKQTKIDSYFNRQTSPTRKKNEGDHSKGKINKQQAVAEGEAKESESPPSDRSISSIQTSSGEEDSVKRNGKKKKSEKKLVRRSRPKLWRKYSDKDMQDYRAGYPGKKDNPRLKKNLQFYRNEIRSYPDGDFIDNIHRKWFGDYRLLEVHHGYIQWLFPIREHGMNFHAQDLQLHEAKEIRKDEEAYERVLISYELMLDFYGMKLKDKKTGEIERADDWESRFSHLNRSMHNYLRITRILKSLGELGYEKFKEPFVRFLMYEALETQKLKNTVDSCMDYWLHTIKDDEARQKLNEYAEQFIENV